MQNTGAITTASVGSGGSMQIEGIVGQKHSQISYISVDIFRIYKIIHFIFTFQLFSILFWCTILSTISLLIRRIYIGY